MLRRTQKTPNEVFITQNSVYAARMDNVFPSENNINAFYKEVQRAVMRANIINKEAGKKMFAEYEAVCQKHII